MSMVFLKNKDGHSIIEILITVSISATVMLLFDSQNVLADRENTVLAKSLSREGLSGASVLLKNNWYGIADGQYGLTFSNNSWSFSGTEDSQSIFTRTITINTLENGEREVVSEVVWQPSVLIPEKNVELSTILTNWVAVVDTGGDDGGGGISGDWQNPQTLGSVDLGPGNSATDLDVKNKIIYMSATASAAAKPDFFIVDASNGVSPFIASQLNTGTGTNAVDAAGNYAYLANDSITAQLQVIDVSSISVPTLIAELQLPDVSGVGAKGNTLFYAFNKIYIGTKQATGPEFHIIDVSEPSSPSALGSFEVGFSVNKIIVANNKAYIATGDTSKELMVLDVSDPSDIEEFGSLNASGSTAGQAVFLENASVFLGKAAGTNGLIVGDISNPEDPTQVSTTSLSGAGINDLNTRDTLAFIGTSDSNKEFQVWNISNLSAPTLWSHYNFPQVASGIDYEDNLVYVAVRSNDALRIITSTPN